MRALRNAVVRDVAVAVVALVLGGCGDPADDFPREPVSGTVAYGGRPLANGTIQFQPDGTREGIASGGMISDGRFQVARDVGPTPGRYRVLIFAIAGPSAAGAGAGAGVADRPIGRAVGGGPAPGRARGRGDAGRGEWDIPPRYNIRTELVADVKAGGPNSYTFELGR